MTHVAAKRLTCGIVMLWALAPPAAVRAQLSIGTWVKSGGSGAGALTMTIEACCNGGRRIIYRINGRSDVLTTVESPLDGSDVPVLTAGKPTGETMGIKRVDDHHTLTVLKMDGKTFGTSKATLSADGKTITIENEYTVARGGLSVGNRTETWVKK